VVAEGVVAEGVVAAHTGSQAEAATRTRGEPIQAEVARTPVEAPTDVVTLAGATLVAEEDIPVAEATTAEEVITADAATAVIMAAAALALDSDSTAHPTVTVTVTAMRPAIADRPATMIRTAIGFLQGAPLILIEC
jgi:hypothetical protein